jgi:RNA polymerase sigma-70 factor (ECF subfamily)
MLININQVLEEMTIPLRSFIRKRVANEQDVEEITQNVLLKIFNRVNTLKNSDSINAWIYQITRNVIIDYYRKESKPVEFVELYEELEEESYEDQNSNKEIAGCLKAMIENLPDKYKQAILLTEYNNLTNKELGELLGLSTSGAKSRVQRARKKLKEMLASCCSLEFDSMGNIIDYKHNMSECKYC